jgi:hypothetical protein
MERDDDFESGGTCPICGAMDPDCEHVALTWVPGDRISGGAAYDEARGFLDVLDEALVEAARSGATPVTGICRNLCLRAARLGRRRKAPVDPDDAPSELDLARWELLEEILAEAPGTEVRDYEVEYGGFCAEDAGRGAYAHDVERVVARLRAEIAGLSR